MIGERNGQTEIDRERESERAMENRKLLLKIANKQKIKQQLL